MTLVTMLETVMMMMETKMMDEYGLKVDNWDYNGDDRTAWITIQTILQLW